MSIILDILGAMVIRGTIVLVILGVNVSLHNLLYKKTSQAVVSQNISLASEDLKNDIKNVGLKATSVSILRAEPTRFEFVGDVDANGIADTVSYYLGSTTELSATDNPNDSKIYRVVGNQPPYDFASGVTMLNFEYFDISGHPTTDVSFIRSVSVYLQMEQGYAFDKAYPSSYWQYHFFPPNL